MTEIGGELGQLQSLGGTFKQQGQNVVELTSTVRSQLGNTYWKGPAAERFRNAWQSEFEPALRKLEAALNEAAQEVNRRREALQQAGT